MILEVRHLYKSFGEKKVLEDVNFNVNSGMISSLIGRNGSGKTTALKILSRALNQDSGDIFIDGEMIDEKISLQSNIAYLPDNFDYFKFTKIGEIPKYYKIIYKDFNFEFYYRELKNLNISLKDIPKNLSKGNKALLGLITVISTKARFILLDEVLDGVDVLNKKKVMRYILDASDNGVGFLIASHQLNELEGISDEANYIGLDGEMESKNIIEKDVNKYQIVLKKLLKKDVDYPFYITGEIGRVYTILSRHTIEEIKKSLGDNLVQYDKLDLKYEDIFIMEEKEEEDERDN